MGLSAIEREFETLKTTTTCAKEIEDFFHLRNSESPANFLCPDQSSPASIWRYIITLAQIDSSINITTQAEEEKKNV